MDRDPECVATQLGIRRGVKHIAAVLTFTLKITKTKTGGGPTMTKKSEHAAQSDGEFFDRFGDMMTPRDIVHMLE